MPCLIPNHDTITLHWSSLPVENPNQVFDYVYGYFSPRIMTMAASPVVSSTAQMNSTLPSCRHGPTWPWGCTVSGWASAAKFALRSSSSPVISSSMTTITRGRATTTTTLTLSVNTPPLPSMLVDATAGVYTPPTWWVGRILSSKVFGCYFCCLIVLCLWFSLVFFLFFLGMVRS